MSRPSRNWAGIPARLRLGWVRSRGRCRVAGRWPGEAGAARRGRRCRPGPAQRGPPAAPGTARGSRRHQAVMRAGSPVAARTPWHQPPVARQGQAPGRWAGMPAGGGRRGSWRGAVCSTGESGRICQPSAARSSASRAGSLDAGMGVLRGGLDRGGGMPTGPPPRGDSGAGRHAGMGGHRRAGRAEYRHPPSPGAAGPAGVVTAR